MLSSTAEQREPRHRSARGQSRIIGEKLAASLAREGTISLAELEKALRKPSDIDRPAWQLVTAGLITEARWAQELASLFGLPSASMADFTIDKELVKLVPEDLARRFNLIPLTSTGNEIYVAITDPTEIHVLDELGSLLKASVQPLVVPPSELAEALRNHYMDHDVSDIEHLDGTLQGLTEAELAELKSAGEDGHVVELVDRLLAHAISIGASDIHIEPQDEQLHIRFRVDGILREGPRYPARLAPWVVSRIKVLARLDIAERFVPQDGKVRTRRRGHEIDLRISCLPVTTGEKVVIRLLGHSSVSKPLHELGFTSSNLKVVRRELARPHGMILVTGPTGSGKTTTLYAALLERASSEINVVTVEDPVEYEIQALNQVPINPARGVTFARALRAILRQDPDVILVGEIRDRETGVTAAEAAVTGHLLLSTLHTNDAASAIHRLLEMDVPGHLLAPSLNLVIAQRLMRRVCDHCTEIYPPTPGELAGILPELAGASVLFNRGVGCGHCDSSGYRGRIPIHEVLVVDEEIRMLISAKASTGEVNAAARKAGMIDLRTAALERLFAGETTIEEFYRVAD